MTEPQTGTLLIQDRAVRTVLPPLLLSLLLDALVCAIAIPLLYVFFSQASGAARGAGTALLAYGLFRILYPLVSRRFPSGGTRAVSWEVTADTLSLDGRRTVRDSIKTVHVWPNRDSLGNPLPGWVVNIETTGQNILLHVPARDSGDRNGDRSGDGVRNGNSSEREGENEKNLRSLVGALGFSDCWTE